MEGTCDATGYVPGGNQVILEPIEAPEAVLQGKIITSKLSSILNYTFFFIRTSKILEASRMFLTIKNSLRTFLGLKSK